MSSKLLRMPTPSRVLATLIEAPDLVRTIRALSAADFSALIQHVGVEDSGEIVALATTEQLVAAFDEDLFANPKPGERETFDVNRFVIWLEVIMEAGDAVGAGRIAELSESFVVEAISSMALVLDNEALCLRMSAGDSSAFYADKAIESSLSEEIDGYLLVSKVDEGWDAFLSLVLALDRDHRSLLVRVLDRCAAISSEYIDDLDALTTALSERQSLSEDVEAEREDRRSKLGYVEPRAAKSFLAMAGKPPAEDAYREQRDPITKAYFREMERKRTKSEVKADLWPRSVLWLSDVLSKEGVSIPTLPAKQGKTGDSIDPASRFLEVMRLLSESNQECFAHRMEELAYLANVLVAGAELNGRRMRASEAAEAALFTVALGAELKARDDRPSKKSKKAVATEAELLDVLKVSSADVLFRKASGILAATAR